jgi:hypothetical protein
MDISNSLLISSAKLATKEWDEPPKPIATGRERGFSPGWRGV